MKLFLDTNILIDFILERQSFYPASAMIISYALEGKIRVCLSSLSVVNANFICTERCNMPKELFRKKMDFLRDIIEICSLTEEQIYRAYDDQWKDFEDAVQYEVAKDSQSQCIVTRNTKDFEDPQIPVFSAEDICKQLAQSEPTIEIS